MDQNKMLLEMLDDRIKQAETNIAVLKSQKAELLTAVVNHARNTIVGKFGYSFSRKACENSPTEKCVYDRNVDPCWEDCLFCHGIEPD